MELIFVALSEIFRSFIILWRTVDIEFDTGKRISKSFLNEADGKMRDIYPYPLPLELFCSVNGCSTSAKWVKNYIALIAADTDYSLQ